MVDRVSDQILVTEKKSLLKQSQVATQYSYLFVHGLDQTGQMFLDKLLADELPLPEKVTRVLFPTAPL